MPKEAYLDKLISDEQHGFDVVETEEDKKENLRKRYAKLLNHLDSVTSNCRIIAERLLNEGHYDLAHKLVIAGQTHDISKFYNDEWEYLCEYDKYMNDPRKMVAIRNHVENNFHHPEAWEYKGGIHAMDDVSLAELTADWYARGEEFGRGVGQFLEEVAFKRYGFDKNSEAYRKINYFFKLLTDRDL